MAHFPAQLEKVTARPVAAAEPPRFGESGEISESIKAQLIEAQLIEASAGPPPRRPTSWPFRLGSVLCRVFAWLFGLASLLVCLAVLAAIPLANFIALGYLLEASGRVARTGRLRDGLIDIDRFARIGSLVAGTWFCLLLPRLVASLAFDAWLIDPAGVVARGWRIALVASVVLVVGHILIAWYCGGCLRHFFWPVLAPFQLAARLIFGGVVGPVVRPAIAAIWPSLARDLYVERPLAAWFPPAMLVSGWRRGRMLAEARDAVWDFTVALSLPHYFWLGLRGFAGALVWLLVPSLMLMAGTSGRRGGVLIGYLGAAAMMYVLFYLPLLQTRFAAENRLAALFDLRAAREHLRRAPLAYWFALASSLLLALPLYLLKIEPPPHELWWTLTLFFILFIYPARLLAGWAVSRMRRHEPRALVSRWLIRLAAVPVLILYVAVLFLTQYTSFLGPASILEQHAFLLPAPFLGL